jgi:hypothetical protein
MITACRNHWCLSVLVLNPSKDFCQGSGDQVNRILGRCATVYLLRTHGQCSTEAGNQERVPNQSQERRLAKPFGEL